MAENSRGWAASARAKGEPALTSARSDATRLRCGSVSASSVSAVSARSSGRPEDTRPASCRVQTASPVELKILAPPPSHRRRPPLPVPLMWLLPTGVTDSGMSACARSRLRALRAVSASSTPSRDWPLASMASKE